MTPRTRARTRRLTWVLGVVLGLVGLSRVVPANEQGQLRADWSPVVYPEQRLPLVFSHRKHLARGTTCVTCHAAALTSRSAVDNLIPTELVCRACHPIDRAEPEKVAPGAPPAQCRACHLGYAPGRAIDQVYLTPPALKFPHAAHAQASCTSCHGTMTSVDLATRAQLPTMASCLTCHRDGSEASRCGQCHLTERGGLLETEFAHGSLVPRHSGLGDAHGPGFGKDHRQEASQVGATCMACHDRSTCLACHQGVIKPLEFHPPGYVTTHAIEARRGTPDCSACHRAQSFCVACHERSGIAVRGSSERRPDAGEFHPPGWASSMRGENHHAREARRNIASCVSCHREDDCLRCHSGQPGSMRASPHPPGWRGSLRCRALDRANRRMCLRCHVTRDELGCDWTGSG